LSNQVQRRRRQLRRRIPLMAALLTVAPDSVRRSLLLPAARPGDVGLDRVRLIIDAVRSVDGTMIMTTTNDTIAVGHITLATSRNLPTMIARAMTPGAAGLIMTMIGTTATAAGSGTQTTMKGATSGRGRGAGLLQFAIHDGPRNMMIRM
jgi:hypothetical protein